MQLKLQNTWHSGAIGSLNAFASWFFMYKLTFLLDIFSKMRFSIYGYPIDKYINNLYKRFI